MFKVGDKVHCIKGLGVVHKVKAGQDLSILIELEANNRFGWLGFKKFDQNPHRHYWWCCPNKVYYADEKSILCEGLPLD